MKQVAIITATVLALSLGTGQVVAQQQKRADQTTVQKKGPDRAAQLKASCEKQAAQKFAFWQFMSRRDFMKKCTGDKSA